MPHILIVEDEAAIADTLVFALQGEGFTTTWLNLAEAALEFQQRTPADLLILDVGLPDISGFEACKRLRRFSDVPVIFLTARDAEIDRVVGLEIGADDYVVKPFSPREVAARVKAILKRMAPRPVEPQGEAGGPFRVDGERVQIHYREQLLGRLAEAMVKDDSISIIYEANLTRREKQLADIVEQASKTMGASPLEAPTCL